MFAEVNWLESPTGSKLAWHAALAGAAETGVVLICHGLAEHSRRYQTFADYLASRGLSAYAFDHRGHGETKALDAPLGSFGRLPGWPKVIADVMAMRAMIADRHPGKPIILFGHSMGGLISLNTALDHGADFAGLAVWNSNFNGGPAGRAAQAILAIEKFFKGSDTPSAMLPKLTFGAWGKSIPDAKTPFDWLSTDPAQVAAYLADPLCGFDAHVSMWIDIFQMMYRGGNPQNLEQLPKSLPVHLVGGAHDPATNGGREIIWLANRLKAAGITDITTTIEPDMRHETLNERDGARAMAGFADWALQRVARS